MRLLEWKRQCFGLENQQTEEDAYDSLNTCLGHRRKQGQRMVFVQRRTQHGTITNENTRWSVGAVPASPGRATQRDVIVMKRLKGRPSAPRWYVETNEKSVCTGIVKYID